ncbi:lymphocyte cytosolic protein 2-like isoform X4 [Mercenaria mercenaria]|uniref:lymphocyte cytosolic protein 2-like isoform X4 n=1 Tax=Mercenaria mercenaria TaxID=6596 RepID=UPI00234F0924|nr:lymphocyte cytosolic protein 2-like isoform X4 [Mercenaria mercenaria]
MSRIKQPLPEYAALIRWTVQEVINWLSENITETDLNNIHCPKKYTREILNQVSMVARPGCPPRTGGFGHRGNQRHVPFNETSHTQDDGSGSEDEGWGEDEFSDYDDEDDNAGLESSVEPTPVAPPRPNRREAPSLPREAAPLPTSNRQPKHRQLPAQPEPEEEEFYEEPEETAPAVRGRPPVPDVRGRPPAPDVRGRPPVPVPDLDGPDEDYEDPDANIKVSNFHGGPLPKPPTHANKPIPIAQRKPPPLPESPRNPLDTESEPEEEYEDPDSTVAAKGPPLPTGPRRPPPPPAEPEEEYEEPDVTVAKKTAPKSVGQRKPPPPPVSSVPTSRSVRNRPPVQEEEYEDPDENMAANHNKPQPPPLSKIPRKPSATASELPAYEMPEGETAPPPVPRNVPRKKPHEPKLQQEETYEIPDETDSAPSRPVPKKYQKPVQEEETYEVPDSDDSEEQDDYLDMDPDNAGPPSQQAPDYLDITDENFGLPKKQSLVSSGPRGRLDVGPKRAAMPLPNESKSHTTKTAADRKAPVEPRDEGDIKVPQKKKVGVQVLPDMKLSNGTKENTPTHPARPGRTLPPPPAVTPERKDPEKKEQVKPVAQSTPHKAELTESDLLRQKWYHGNIKRVDAEVKLKQLSIDGMYLIRKSSQGSDQPYTLQIFYRGKVYNLPIRRRSDNLFAVGKEGKDNEKACPSLLDLVNTFKQNILVLSGGAETKLVKSLPKS